MLISLRQTEAEKMNFTNVLVILILSYSNLNFLKRTCFFLNYIVRFRLILYGQGTKKGGECRENGDGERGGGGAVEGGD